MAVFTPLTKLEIESFMASHTIGDLISFEGILQGVDNTNYKIETSTGKFILTIFENRINPDDLPFFIRFMAHLKEHGIVCPSPIGAIKTIKSKPAAVFSFLEGRGVTVTDITPDLCYELGILLAKMHIVGQSFPMIRKNSMSFDAWESRFHKIGHVASSYKATLDKVKQEWPANLPKGAVHLDLFPDNTFIKDHHIFGVIDFYFSASDFLAYDLAIVMNAWCFDEITFNMQKWEKLLSGYQSIRPLTEEEKKSYQILCQGAVLRFLSSRLHDYLFHDPKNMVTPKLPDEYIQKLEFHLHDKLF
jgi:homoserine kinase type II